MESIFAILKALGPSGAAVLVVYLFLNHWEKANTDWGNSRDEERKLTADERQKQLDVFEQSLASVHIAHAADREAWQKSLAASHKTNAELVKQNTRMVDHCILKCDSNQKGT